jgi:crotonobetainyl-CoA:carnitine CoA-transferase CaiB-like acyl-CoA transferase
MCRFPGFGLSGPYKYYKGFGATMEGLMGHTLLRGYRDSDPSQTPISQHSDPNAGAQAAFGVLAAVAARERTGRGQLVEFAQSEALVHHLSYALFDYQMTGRVQEHWGNRHPSMAPYGVFPCAGEDNWITLAIGTDEAFAALCSTMGQPELATDPRFADVVSRHRHQDGIEALVGAWTRTRDKREAMMELQAAGVLAAAVLHPWEVLDDPHLEAREFFLRITHPECGTHRYPGTVAKLRHRQLRPEAPAPLLGEHNEEILCGLLGLEEAAYRQLLADDIVGTAYLETAR